MTTKLKQKKDIALVAHDHRKNDLIEWCILNKNILKNHSLYATGTTGTLLENELKLPIKKFLSGPLGGDFQIGSSIVDLEIDMLFFFWDPLESLAHDPDVKALLRLATLYNIPMACNQSSADFFISSELMDKEYERNFAVIERYKKNRTKQVKEGI